MKHSNAHKDLQKENVNTDNIKVVLNDNGATSLASGRLCMIELLKPKSLMRSAQQYVSKAGILCPMQCIQFATTRGY